MCFLFPFFLYQSQFVDVCCIQIPISLVFIVLDTKNEKKIEKAKCKNVEHFYLKKRKEKEREGNCVK